MRNEDRRHIVNRMPRPTYAPQVSPRVVHGLLLELERFRNDEQKVRSEYPWAERFVMGLPLAPWQRGFKWSMEQSQRFITSVWTGVHLGNYVLTEDNMEPGTEVKYKYLANCVLEGQQRLKAIELYVSDELAVPDERGVLTKWSELDRVEHLRFKKVIFNCGTVRETNEERLREFYDLMNFGGTQHEESERATRR